MRNQLVLMFRVISRHFCLVFGIELILSLCFVRVFTLFVNNVKINY